MIRIIESEDFDEPKCNDTSIQNKVNYAKYLLAKAIENGEVGTAWKLINFLQNTELLDCAV